MSLEIPKQTSIAQVHSRNRNRTNSIENKGNTGIFSFTFFLFK